MTPSARAPGRPPALRLVVALSVVAALCGCATLRYPFSKAELAERNDARALIHYLRQPGSSPAVCGRSPRGFHVTARALDKDGFAELTDAFVRGKIRPRAFEGCVRRFFLRLPRDRGQMLSSELLRALPRLLEQVANAPPALPEALTLLLRLYGERPTTFETARDHRTEVASLLRKHKASLSPALEATVRALGDILDAESGFWRGARVGATALDDLVRRRRRAVLALLSRRLPNEGLRAQALRRLIRVRVLQSPHRALRRFMAEVERAVMRNGFYAVPLDRHPITSARLETVAIGESRLVLVQDLLNQVVTLRRDRDHARHRLRLRNVLWFRVKGLHKPITLCPSIRSSDPTPCIAASALEVDHPRAQLVDGGEVRLSSMSAAAALTEYKRIGATLTLPIRWKSAVLATLSFPVRWERPEPLVFAGGNGGRRGPDLRVEVTPGPRVELRISGAGRDLLAVVERRDLTRFSIQTQGGQGVRGADGSSGWDGSDGSSGSDASCGSDGTSGGDGTSGSDGSDGGPGGPGGPGGDVVITLRCATESCADLKRILAARITSHGGPGGRGGNGGSGGRGGRGGRGGSGTSCTDSDGNTKWYSGGSNGSDGSDGSSGSNGPPGPPGAPGRVDIVLGGSS